MKKDIFSQIFKNFRLKAVVAFVLALTLLFCGCGFNAADPTDSTGETTTQSTLLDETTGTGETTESTGPASNEGSQSGAVQTPGGQTNSQSNSQSGNNSQSNSQSSNNSQSNNNTQSNNNSQSNNNTPSNNNSQSSSGVGKGQASPVSLSAIPAYSGNPYVKIDGNIPNFSAAELTTKGYEKYSSLDSLGRAHVAVASVGKDTMPAAGEERGNISSIKPTGWVQAQYDCVSGRYLYNRSHLIGWQLSAENANEANLITGTKYLNSTGMLPFENQVADYIKETGNHVAYRVTPIYSGNDLVARGVQMEAYSVEDNGDGICFNVFCYNVQPEITINYATGASTGPGSENESDADVTGTWILNTNSKKFHDPDCSWAEKISEKNRGEHTGSRQELIDDGYSPCGSCNP